jgi:hypothetical protein
LECAQVLINGLLLPDHFQERFTHLFVDEFQDTDPLQAEILVLLSASDPAASHWRSVTPVPGKLFIVGEFSKLSVADWLQKHGAVSEEDFLREPHRNRFTVLLGRTAHIAYHLGQAKLSERVQT